MLTHTSREGEMTAVRAESGLSPCFLVVFERLAPGLEDLDQARFAQPS
jgi:hypothetical protein